VCFSTFSEQLAFDLLEQVGDGLVVEGQAATQQGVQDDPAAPHIHLRSRVELARYHLEGMPEMRARSGGAQVHLLQVLTCLDVCF